jgi:hypothetical protein
MDGPRKTVNLARYFPKWDEGRPFLQTLRYKPPTQNQGMKWQGLLPKLELAR